MDIKEIISSGVIELYVLGVATQEEIQLVEDCIANHPETTLAEIDAVQNALNTNATLYAKEPPAHLEKLIENKLFGNLNETTEVIEKIETKQETISGKVVPFSKLTKYVAAASILLLIGSVVTNLFLYNKYNNLTAKTKTIQEKLDEQVALNTEIDNQVGAITNKYTQAVSLPGTITHPNALAKIYWIKNTGDVYIDPQNLPDAPKGMQYQFWAIVDGKPVDGGLILKNGKLKVEKLKTFGKAEAFAITLEKEGGVPQPTMENMYVMAKT